MKILTAILVPIGTTAGFAGDFAAQKEALRWYDLHHGCRIPDDFNMTEAQTEKACADRDQLTKALQKHGMCFDTGKQEWRECADSVLINDETLGSHEPTPETIPLPTPKPLSPPSAGPVERKSALLSRTADHAFDAQNVVSRWNKQNRICHQGSADDPSLDYSTVGRACIARDGLTALLNKHGMCFDNDEQEWFKCRIRFTSSESDIELETHPGGLIIMYPNRRMGVECDPTRVSTDGTATTMHFKCNDGSLHVVEADMDEATLILDGTVFTPQDLGEAAALPAPLLTAPTGRVERKSLPQAIKPIPDAINSFLRALDKE